MKTLLAVSSTTVNLSSGWSTIWNSISGDSSLWTLLDVVGAMLVLGSLLLWVWRKRSGQAQHHHLAWSAILGGILVAPNLLIPAFLTVVDDIVNSIGKII